MMNNDAFVSAATADAYSMVDLHLVSLFMKMHPQALLEDNLTALTFFVVLSCASCCLHA